MGIQGLLPFVKKATKQTHIRKYNGQTAAVDGYGWLYKAAFGCAVKLGMGEPTDAYVKYIMKHIDVLIDNGVKPVIVFDGRSLPAKEITNSKRRQHRKENRKKALNLVRKGDKKAAWEYFIKSIEVTHEMVQDVIQVLRQKHIDYIIAPYEADAQLAYLQINGLVDVVITEDSDLVVFGVTKALFKFKVSGDCQAYDSALLHKSMDVPYNKFSFEKFRHMCILSGCDYLESLNGVGLTRAKKFITQTDISVKSVQELLKLIPTILKLDVEVTEEYIKGFLEAENSFLYQLVFDPVSKKLVPLCPYPSHVIPENMVYCGEYDVTEEEAYHLAVGNMHTKTLQRLGDYDIYKDKGYQRCSKSIWCRNPGTLLSCGVTKSVEVGKVGTPTKGLSATVSMNSVMRKRRIDTGDNAEPSDAEVLSIYKEETEVITDSSTRNTKKVKVSLVNSDTFKAKGRPSVKKEEEMDTTTSEPEETASPTKRRKNPFLKSPDIGKLARSKVLVPIQCDPDSGSRRTTRSSTGKLSSTTKVEVIDADDLDPVCLVNKDHVYNFEDHPNIVVKSKYFRDSVGTLKIDSTSESQDSGFSATPDGKKSLAVENSEEAESQVSLYNVDTSNLPQTESQILDDMMSNANLLGSQNIEDLHDELEEDLHASSYFNTPPISSSTTSGRPATRNSLNSSSGKNRKTPPSLLKPSPSARSQGLKKGFKPDAKQRSVFDMFAKAK